LIHELNKEVLPSTYLYDKVIVELKAGTALELPTYHEVDTFLEQITGASLPDFDYTQDLAETERELAEWEQSRQTASEPVNAHIGAEVIEGMFRALKRATEASESAVQEPKPSEDAQALAD